MNKKKGKGKRRNRTKSNSSTLGQHKRMGKTLLPPMLHMLPQDKMSFSSWINNRLPEVLWAVIAARQIPRQELLRTFSRIAEKLSIEAKSEGVTEDSDVTHTALSARSGGIEQICSVLLEHPAGASVIRPLLLFDSLPGRDRWALASGDEPSDEDAAVLVAAVARTLDHQSQESTDIRWLTLMFKIATGKVQFPSEMVGNLLKYLELTPDSEEMRYIRPSIRAAEMAFRMVSPDKGETESDWCKSFWMEALERTQCIPFNKQAETAQFDEEKLQNDWFEKQYELVERFHQVQSTTEIDARLDAIFGIALYSGNVLLEVMHGKNRIGIAGRVLLRTLVECRITLAYLVAKDDMKLWDRFRRFGVGQAKLALLKFDNAAVLPKFLSEESLASIANEDASEEFVAVDLGHWSDADLRKMADLAGVKEDYDAFYGWSSSFVHGSWAAIRDASLATCLNPLHRMHRVPRGIQRHLESVIEDGVGLYNKICTDVDKAYDGVSKCLVLAVLQKSSDREVRGSDNASA